MMITVQTALLAPVATAGAEMGGGLRRILVRATDGMAMGGGMQ